MPAPLAVPRVRSRRQRSYDFVANCGTRHQKEGRFPPRPVAVTSWRATFWSVSYHPNASGRSRCRLLLVARFVFRGLVLFFLGGQCRLTELLLQFVSEFTQSFVAQ